MDCMAAARHVVKISCLHARKGLSWGLCLKVQLNHQTIGFLEALRMELQGTEAFLYLTLLVT